MKKQLFSLLLICSFNLFGMEEPYNNNEQPPRALSPVLPNASQNNVEASYAQLATAYNDLRAERTQLDNKIQFLEVEKNTLQTQLASFRNQLIFTPVSELGDKVPITSLLGALHLSGVSVSSQYGVFLPEMFPVTTENRDGSIHIDINVDPVVDQVKRTLPFSQRHPRITNTATFTFGAAIMGALCWNGWFQEKWDTASNYCSPIVSRLSTFFNR